MRKRIINILVSLVIFSMILLISFSLSNAPMKVHIVNIVGIIISFFLPSLFVFNTKELKEKLRLVILFILIGVILYDILSSLVIIKREIFMGGLVLYPIWVLFFLGLQFIHAFLCQSIINLEKVDKHKLKKSRIRI